MAGHTGSTTGETVGLGPAMVAVARGVPISRPTRPARRPQGLTKVSVNLVERAMAALEIATELSGDSQTDVINRSVQVYAYLLKAVADGKDLKVEDPRTNRVEHPIFL